MIMTCERPPTGQGAELAARARSLVPELETKTLILRAPRVEDFGAYAEIALSPRGRHLGIRSREDAWYDFSAMVANWMFRGHGVWTITPGSGGALLGFVLIGLEPGDAAPELGYVLTEAAEGRNIAFEAASAVRRYAVDTLGLGTLVSYVAADNARSIRLTERLGAVRRDAPAPDGMLCYHHPTGREGA